MLTGYPLCWVRHFSTMLSGTKDNIFFLLNVEPIAIDPKTSTVPIIDNFRYDTFEFQSGGSGSRVDWNFVYHGLPRRPEDSLHPKKPAPTPIMLGGAFLLF